MSERVVVLQAVPRCWLEQTQTWLYDQVRFLRPPVDPHVVCERTANLGQFPAPNVHALTEAPRHRRVLDHLCRATRLRRYLGLLVERGRHLDARIMHSHFGTVGWSNLGAARRLDARHVVTFYGFDVSAMPRIDRRWHDRYAALFGQADAVLCEGPHMASCVIELGCPVAKVRVHRLGVDVDRIPFRPRSWDATGPLRVLLAAAFREKKGIPIALEALARLRERVDVEITIIGDATSAPGSADEKVRILETIDRHRLGGSVRLLGFQPHDRLLEEAARHHVFVAPSVTASDGDTEGGAPVCVIEMAASGMPIVASRHCDIPEIVDHGRTGYLADERDVDGLATQLERVVAEHERWTAMLRQGREHVETTFAAQEQGRLLSNLYMELAA